MNRINVRFESDSTLDHIDVVVRAPAQDKDVTALMEQLSGYPPDTLTVSDREGKIRTIPVGGIITISAGERFVVISTEDGIWYSRRTLQDLEDELGGWRFFRISRFELVNLDKVLHYDFTLAGTLRLELVNGTETWASRRKIPAIRKLLLGKG